ncbi:MAG: hypothetical protein ABIP63_04095, partial [Thermoanaerobaculia bacterium]
MRDDLPAAVPLIGFVAGLALGHQPGTSIAFCLVAALLCGMRRARLALLCFAMAGGVATAVHRDAVRAADDRNLLSVPADRFVVVTAPLNRDWARNGESYMLRCDRFQVSGEDIRRPLFIYVRFPPPPIGMSGSLRAEGFLRRSLRGESTLTLKSPTLLAYGPDLAPYLPGSWNRVLMM